MRGPGLGATHRKQPRTAPKTAQKAKKMKTLFSLITALKNVVLLSHRVSEVEKELASLRDALNNNKSLTREKRAELDHRLMRLEHFFEFANRFLTRR